MKKNVKYEFHHFGIPVTYDIKEGNYSESAGMYTLDNPGKFRVQWHHFTDDSPLHILIRTLPHVAFKVDNLEEAIQGEIVILGPYEPIDDYFVAMIDDSGVPIELIQTTLSDEELWRRAREKMGILYQ
ncbi:VOC family protein [Serratia marcescens]|uniref:VOC family protein n=1 Tax=Serratia TaxID=613 RepID=UPI0015D6ECCA|nr:MULTISPECIES: hypothetical protein [Serratia]MBJ2089988.1 hypothetical protein [Serratia ureilytica]MBN3987620.1 hypothetical protein [Serratia marcescens]MCX2173122.1 hypothetical protein [Serratia marcescens]MCX2177257.1 hypothetical protein [Serratia marcescens]QLJ58502.1 hypothetical protein HP475_00430 [Serratia marcescens]